MWEKISLEHNNIIRFRLTRMDFIDWIRSNTMKNEI